MAAPPLRNNPVPSDLETRTHLTNPRGAAPKQWPSFKGEPTHVPHVLGGPGPPVPPHAHPGLALALFNVPAPTPGPQDGLAPQDASGSPAAAAAATASASAAAGGRAGRGSRRDKGPGRRRATGHRGSGSPSVPHRRTLHLLKMKNEGQQDAGAVGADGARGRRSSGASGTAGAAVGPAARELSPSVFGPQPVVVYGPSIPEYLAGSAFHLAVSPDLFNPDHPAMVLPLPLLFKVFAYLSIEDLFVFSRVDWAAKDRVDEYLLYSSLVLGVGSSHSAADTLRPQLWDSVSISSSESDASFIGTLGGGGGGGASLSRRSSLALAGNGAGGSSNNELMLPRRKMSTSSLASGGGPSVSSMALAMNSMRSEIQKYQAAIVKLKAKDARRKAKLARVKAALLASNSKTVEVMQQLANKNDSLRMSLAEERQAHSRTARELAALKVEAKSAKARVNSSAATQESLAIDLENANAQIRELEANVALQREQLSAARSAAAVADRARDRAEAHVAYLSSLGFEDKAGSAVDLLNAMSESATALRNEKRLLQRAVHDLGVVFAASHMALSQTLAVLAPSFKHADVSMSDLEADILGPLSKVGSLLASPTSSAALTASVSGAAAAEPGDESIPDMSAAATLAYLNNGGSLARSSSSLSNLSRIRAHTRAGIVPRTPLDSSLFDVVVQMQRSRARNKLIMFCAQFMGKREVEDPLRWGAAVFIQSWWRDVHSSHVLYSSLNGVSPTKRKKGHGLVVPHLLPYWHDRYGSKHINMTVDAIDLDLLVRRISAAREADATLLDVTLASFPEFMDCQELFHLLVVRYFSLPQDSADLPFFMSSVQPLIQQQVVRVLLRWLCQSPEDFADPGLSSSLERFLVRASGVASDPTLSVLLGNLGIVLDLVQAAEGNLVPYTGLGGALRACVTNAHTGWTAIVDYIQGHTAGPHPTALGLDTLMMSVQMTGGIGAPPSLILSAGVLRSIVQVHPVELARQLALMDFAVFARIKRSELLRQVFVKPDPRRDAPNVQQLIDQFNWTSSWAMGQVLMGESPEDRASIICMLIDVGLETYTLGNFSALMAVVSGLQGAAISRLRHTWPLLPSHYADKWEHLKGLMSMNHNYHSYRDALKRRDAPAVPYLGVFLQDLVFIDDGNPSLVGQHNLVNITKHAMNAGVIRELLRLQNASYEFHPVDAIQRFLRSCVSLDEDTLFARSLAVEPRDSKVSKRKRVAYTSPQLDTLVTISLDNEPEIMKDFIELSTLETVDMGGVILHAGDSSTFLYMIAHGVVQVHLPGGDAVFLSDGQLVGEMAVFMGRKRSATVSVVTPTTLLKLPSKNLGILLRKHPELAKRLSALARARADDTESRRTAPAPASGPAWHARLSSASATKWMRSRQAASISPAKAISSMRSRRASEIKL